MRRQCTPQMICLAIDTTGPDCAAALIAGTGGRTRELAARSQTIGRGHAEHVVPMIKAVLGEGGTGFDQLDGIAVTRGPGSFTGIRIGVAAARGLALALTIPAVGIDGLSALLHGFETEPDELAVAALDARRNEIYARAEAGPGGDAVLASCCATAAAVAGRLLETDFTRFHVIGSGGAMLAARLQELGAAARTGPALEAAPIDNVAAMGLAAFGADPIRLAPGQSPPEPLYLRPADAKPQVTALSG